MTRVIIYTCITGQYDRLQEPAHFTHDATYIAFVDNPEDYKDIDTVWQIRKTHHRDDHQDNPKLRARYHKIMYHEVLADDLLEGEQVIIWIDGNMQITANLENLIATHGGYTNFELVLAKHPQRHCAYDEITACLELGKDTEYHLNQALHTLKYWNYPKNNGLFATGLMLRQDSPELQLLMNKWWKYLIDLGTSRDQISLMLAIDHSIPPARIFRMEWQQLLQHVSIKGHKATYQYHNIDLFDGVPFSPEKNLGSAYNSYIRTRRSFSDWSIIRDYDTCWLTPGYRSIIEQAIKDHPDTGMFVCYGRSGISSQQMNVSDPNNMAAHRLASNILEAQQPATYTEVTKAAGFMMVINHKAWFKVKGFRPTGILGVDTDYCARLIAAGYKIRRINRLYIYHYYRHDTGTKDTTHLDEC